jgi:hypothetical protein
MISKEKRIVRELSRNSNLTENMKKGKLFPLSIVSEKPGLEQKFVCFSLNHISFLQCDTITSKQIKNTTCCGCDDCDLGVFVH